MLDKYINEQTKFYNIIFKSISNKKISHAYLIESNGYDKAEDLALSFAKTLYCPFYYFNRENCNTCNDCSLIDDHRISNIKIIDTDGMWIKKDQMLDLQNEFMTKSFNGRPKIYIIKDAEKLNKSSANTILKFLEEPFDNIIAILVANNKHNVIDTILSRCIVFSLENSELVMSNKITYDDTLLNLVLLLEKNKSEFIAQYNDYLNFKKLDKDDIMSLFQGLNEIYSDIFNAKTLNIKIDNKILEEISLLNDLNSLANKIRLINRQFNRIKSNSNINLLIDKFIIDFSKEVNNV